MKFLILLIVVAGCANKKASFVKHLNSAETATPTPAVTEPTSTPEVTPIQTPTPTVASTQGPTPAVTSTSTPTPIPTVVSLGAFQVQLPSQQAPGSVNLTWTASANAFSYKAILASDSECQSIVSQSDALTALQVDFVVTNEGTYFVCVYSQK